jgi:folate-dependent phosphoribosylglycinamide formyltransferase PurN
VDKFWIAFFSQTGSEIVAISKAIGRKPDLIVTNNVDESKYQYHPELRQLGVVIQSAKHDVLMTYFSGDNLYAPENTIITLHGYLRIIPADVCDKYEMYNGHPGLITHYPELKGKDPQIRAWEGKYPVIGSVVHKVTAGVDEGEVVKSLCYTNRTESVDEIFGVLKDSSLQSWIWFIKDKV